MLNTGGIQTRSFYRKIGTLPVKERMVFKERHDICIEDYYFETREKH